jgi:hypothetical protein
MTIKKSYLNHAACLPRRSGTKAAVLNCATPLPLFVHRLGPFACVPHLAPKKGEIAKRTQIKNHKIFSINEKRKNGLASFSKTNPISWPLTPQEERIRFAANRYVSQCKVMQANANHCKRSFKNPFFSSLPLFASVEVEAKVPIFRKKDCLNLLASPKPLATAAVSSVSTSVAQIGCIWKTLCALCASVANTPINLNFKTTRRTGKLPFLCRAAAGNIRFT